jgi:prepilin signal peptidase PulO-like enzyme (type II secretory pathway)
MEKSQHTQVDSAESAVLYAGFWLRLVAALVDTLAMFIPFCFVAFIVTVIVKLASASKGYEPATAILIVLTPVAIVATWLYFADSGRCRSAFWADADHLIRAMSISDSGGCRSLIPG